MRPLFGDRGVIHPTPERRSPGSVGSVEAQKASAEPGFAAGSLDEVGHD